MAWFVTMIFIAMLGGFGMGTSIDWYVESQRIQSARTVRDASYSIWAGTVLILTRNALWAVAILGFFVPFPDSVRTPPNTRWPGIVLGFKVLPAGLVGCFFAGILAIHFSTISTHTEPRGHVFHPGHLPSLYQSQGLARNSWSGSAGLSTLGMLIGSFFYGLMMENITQWLIFALWIMAAGIWLPSILQVVWWRFNSWGYLASWLANLALSWLVVWVLPAYDVIPELPDYHPVLDSCWSWCADLPAGDSAHPAG